MTFKNIFSSLILLVSLSACSQNNVQKISAKEYNRLNADNKIAVYDVRTTDEFTAGHIPNAVNSNWLDGSFTKEISHLDPKKPIIVYCKSGGRSAKAVQALREKGFTTIYELDGGYDKYVLEAEKTTKK